MHLRKTLPFAVLVLALLVPAAPAGPKAQSSIALPDEFRPEGIATGKHGSFYVGSIPQGAVYRGSYKTGDGAVLVPPHAGRNHVGLKVDRKHDLIFVAGGASKAIYVYDASTGEDVAAFPLDGAGFVNDVVLTKRAAYFTDSQVQQLYRVSISKKGELGTPETVPISGDFQYEQGFNANGIEARGERRLIVVQSNSGELFVVNGRTGESRQVAVDQALTNGDGLLLRGRRLFVVQNRDNRIAVVRLRGNLATGEVRRFITSPLFDVPTTIAPFKQFIYAVNARFDRPDDSDDDVVRVGRR